MSGVIAESCPDTGHFKYAAGISVIADGLLEEWRPAEVDRASTDRRLLGCWIDMSHTR